MKSNATPTRARRRDKLKKWLLRIPGTPERESSDSQWTQSAQPTFRAPHRSTAGPGSTSPPTPVSRPQTPAGQQASSLTIESAEVQTAETPRATGTAPSGPAVSQDHIAPEWRTGPVNPTQPDPQALQNIASSSTLALTRPSEESSATVTPAESATQVYSPGAVRQGSNSKESRLSPRPTQPQLWSQALKRLSDSERATVSEHAGVDSTKSNVATAIDAPSLVQELRDIAEKKKNEAQEKAWTLEFNGRKIILRDVADKIVTWLDRVKDVGDILVTYDPVHAALPWAAVRFLLTVSAFFCLGNCINLLEEHRPAIFVEGQVHGALSKAVLTLTQAVTASIEQTGQLLVGMEQVTRLLFNCRVYESLYLTSMVSADSADSATSQLEAASVDLYVEILRFLCEAIKLYQSLIKKVVNALFTPTRLSDHLSRFKDLGDQVKDQAEICEMQHGREVQQMLGDKYERLRRSLEDRLVRIDKSVGGLWVECKLQERCDILKWISEIPYETDHDTASKDRVNGTCEWLLKTPQYLDWRDSSESKLLWLHGIPGAGKTTLVSKVVDDSLDLQQKSQNNEAVGYWYCDRNREDRRNPTEAIRSFVRQLAASQRDTEIMPLIAEAYTSQKARGFSKDGLTMGQCKDLLFSLTNLYPQSTLILDAMDECDPKSRQKLIDSLVEVLSRSTKPVKLFIASRNDTDLVRNFSGQSHLGPHLEIQATDNKDDIKRFVRDRIHQNHWCKTNMLEEVRQQVEQVFTEKSQGMFQWAAMHIDELLDLEDISSILSSLTRLPRGLKTAYASIWTKIQDKDGRAPILAKRAFQWLMCSWRPLSPTELVAAVCQDPDSVGPAKVDTNIELVLKACHNLIVVAETGISGKGVCRFSHLSVQEYFEQHHWNPAVTNSLVGRVCLKALMHTSPTDGLQTSEERLTFSDLRSYSDGWFTHARLIPGHSEDALSRLVAEFLGEPSQSSQYYQTWILRCCDGRKIAGGVNLLDVYSTCRPETSAILGVVYLGLEWVLSGWLQQGFTEVNQRGTGKTETEYIEQAKEWYQSTTGDECLLLIAARRGFVNICKALLEAGAKVNVVGGHYGTALHAAAARGDEKCVELLLRYGADVNAISGDDNCTPLYEAAGRGHEKCVELLLDFGADVNALLENHRTALLHALGHRKCVEILLRRGADPNLTGKGKATALVSSCYSKNISNVKLLLEHGADVNITSQRLGSALIAACTEGGGNVELLELLLQAGADVTKKGGVFFGTALGAVFQSEHGREEKMIMLLKAGAVFEESDYEYARLYQGEREGNVWRLKAEVERLQKLLQTK